MDARTHDAPLASFLAFDTATATAERIDWHGVCTLFMVISYSRCANKQGFKVQVKCRMCTVSAAMWCVILEGSGGYCKGSFDGSTMQ